MCVLFSQAATQAQATDCPANTYLNLVYTENTHLSSSTCVNCPMGGVSSAGSTNIWACSCPADTYQSWNIYSGVTCLACPTGAVSSAGSTSTYDCKCPVDTYSYEFWSESTSTYNVTCDACPMNSTSSVGSSSCTCPVNTYWLYSLKSCNACPMNSTSSVGSYSCTCPANTYYSSTSLSSTCNACPTGTESSVGSYSSYQCSCPADTYKSWDANNVVTCSACPTGAVSSAGSTSTYDCKCPVDAYFYQSWSESTFTYNVTCNACPIGAVSSVGSYECNCPADTYISWSANYLVTCNACPMNSTSSVGSQSCTCPVNTYWSNSLKSCIACPTGSTSSAGSYSCTCPANTYYSSNSSSSTCVNCPMGGVSSAGSTDAWQCDCPADTYQSWITYNVATCLACPTGAVSLAGSYQEYQCSCPADTYFYQSWSESTFTYNVTCNACPMGLTSSVGSYSCICPVNTYWLYSLKSCNACPMNSTSSVGSVGSYSCTCPANTYYSSTSLSSTCVNCPTGAESSIGSTSSNQCNCPADTYMSWDANNVETCSACPTGAVSPAGSRSIYNCNCPVDTYKYEFSSPIAGTIYSTYNVTCNACPTGSTSSAGSFFCTATTLSPSSTLSPTPTYYVSASNTVTPSASSSDTFWLGSPPCPVWLNKCVTGGNIYIIPDSIGWTGNDCGILCTLNTTCYAWCSNNAIGCSLYDNTYTGISDRTGSIAGVGRGPLCQSPSSTSQATYVSASDTVTPSVSPSSTVSPTLTPSMTPTTTDATTITTNTHVCSAGQFWNNAISECVSCPPGSVNLLAGGTSGKSSFSDCIPCSATTRSANGWERCYPPDGGWYISSPGFQSRCNAGTYAAENSAFDISGCIICPANTWSDHGHDRCYPPDAGKYIRIPGVQSYCPPGTFSTLGSAFNISGCILCPINTWSDTGFDRCYPPDAGQFIRVPGVQSSCPPGTFSTHGSAFDISGCIICPANTRSERGWDRCWPPDAGHYISSPGQQFQCPAGTYSLYGSAFNISGCIPCPANTRSNQGSNRCEPPDAGWFMSSPGLQIHPCPAGTSAAYGTAFDFSGCIPCAIGTYSNTGSSLCHFTCSAGTTTMTTGAESSTQCVLCPLGFYCPYGAPLTCPHGFQPNTGAVSGATSCSACPAGQYTDAASIVFFCTACSAGGYCLGGAPRQLCPANTFNPSVGRSSECTVCSTGYFSAKGSVACASSTFSPNGILTDTSLFCNASVSLSTSVSLDRVITFVNNTVGGDAPPLLFLPASSFYNPLPKDIIVASSSACASFITTPGATKCIATSNYILPTGNFSFLGEAASLGMTAAPYCGS
jgi:hypothetical protein